MPQVLEAVTAKTPPPAKARASVDADDGFSQTLDQQKRQSQAAGDRQQSADGETPDGSTAPPSSNNKEVAADSESAVVVQQQEPVLDLELTDTTELIETEADSVVPVLDEESEAVVVTNHRPQVQAATENMTTSKVELSKQIAVSLEAVANATEAEVDMDSQKTGSSQVLLLNNEPKDAKIKNFNGLLEKQSGIPVPVGEQNWSKQFADRVLVLTQQGLSSAKLHLNPAELGPLEIRISVHQDQASLSISSSHALVRDSIEQSLPRLRELLEEAGLTLADVDVNAQSQQQNQGEQGQAQGQGDSSVEDGESAEVTQSSQTSSSNAVDFYA